MPDAAHDVGLAEPGGRAEDGDFRRSVRFLQLRGALNCPLQPRRSLLVNGGDVESVQSGMPFSATGAPLRRLGSTQVRSWSSSRSQRRKLLRGIPCVV
jgi:hypothetical protein